MYSEYEYDDDYEDPKKKTESLSRLRKWPCLWHKTEPPYPQWVINLKTWFCHALIEAYPVGLSLELNVEQDGYIGLMTPEAGIRMDISTQGKMPFPMEKGGSISPGYSTMIGLRKACGESCLAYNQRQQCNCMEYRFPGSDKSICNVLDKPTAKCLAKVQRMFKENKLNCKTSCPPPRREDGFKTSSSFAFWPSEKHELSGLRMRNFSDLMCLPKSREEKVTESNEGKDKLDPRSQPTRLSTWQWVESR